MAVLAVLSLVLGMFLVAVSAFAVVVDRALNITAQERDLWYRPMKEVEFEILDADVCDD